MQNMRMELTAGVVLVGLGLLGLTIDRFSLGAAAHPRRYLAQEYSYYS